MLKELEHETLASTDVVRFVDVVGRIRDICTSVWTADERCHLRFFIG